MNNKILDSSIDSVINCLFNSKDIKCFDKLKSYKLSITNIIFWSITIILIFGILNYLYYLYYDTIEESQSLK
jgi:hypothetical protein